MGRSEQLKTNLREVHGLAEDMHSTAAGTSLVQDRKSEGLSTHVKFLDPENQSFIKINNDIHGNFCILGHVDTDDQNEELNALLKRGLWVGSEGEDPYPLPGGPNQQDAEDSFEDSDSLQNLASLMGELSSMGEIEVQPIQ
ncbi:MAG: hypothetical protein U5L95_00700 [Candidatus Saccharibacteria bacterium]|nr:hypothetical protein [Candidatus Saccharibacteria bacterium]